MTFKDSYGYPIWIPLTGISLFLGITASIVAFLVTGNARYLIITGFCYFILASK